MSQNGLACCAGNVMQQYRSYIADICHFSRIFQKSRIAHLQHWIFFSTLDVLLMVLEKSEVIFLSSEIKQEQW